DAAVRLDRCDENVRPAELEIDARAAALRRADDFRSQHLLVPRGGRLRVWTAQVDVVIGERGHKCVLRALVASAGERRTPQSGESGFGARCQAPGVRGSAAPTRQSRVTRAASSDSLIPSVPAGRIGTTM